MYSVSTVLCGLQRKYVSVYVNKRAADFGNGIFFCHYTILIAQDVPRNSLPMKTCSIPTFSDRTLSFVCFLDNEGLAPFYVLLDKLHEHVKIEVDNLYLLMCFNVIGMYFSNAAILHVLLLTYLCQCSVMAVFVIFKD